MRPKEISNQQPCQKKFGELLKIQKPDEHECDLDLSFELLPELPSHVPTPKTINQGLGPIHHQLRTLFAADDGAPKKRRTKRRKQQSQGAQSTTQAAPQSPHATKGYTMLVASPHSSKWGRDVWESKRNFLRPPLMNKRPSSPSDSSQSTHITALEDSEELVNTGDDSAPIVELAKIKRKEIGNDAMTLTPNTNYHINRRTSSPSPLQRKWMQENALNLHASCQDLSVESNSRRPFLFRPRRASVR